MDGNFAVKLPDGMDPFTTAPLYCAGVTVYKALKVSQVRPGQWVSIVGVGGLGKSELSILRRKKKDFSYL
jgi:propanol-preferring alcohol dehydrogenase